MVHLISDANIALILVAPFIGSFLGVVVKRIPEGKSVIFGRSHCDNCPRILGLIDLLPLASWVASGGRCRGCGARISVFYPTIEIAAVAVAAWAVFVVPGWLAWPTAALGWALIALSYIDVQHLRLPDVLTLPLIVAGLVLAPALPGSQLVNHAIGAAAGWGLFWVTADLFVRVTGKAGLGLGDAKLLAAAGAWLGWLALPSVLLLAASSGLTVALVARWAGAMQKNAPLPFGPFLALGFWLTWLYGPLTF